MNDKTEVLAVEDNNVVPMVQHRVDYVAMAIEKNADLATIEKFMDLQQRNDEYEAKKQFVSAMSEFRANCPSIVKTKKGHNSNYAGLAETIDQIKGILAKCGLSHSWRTTQDNGKITVACIVTHVAGHSESTALESPPETSGSKNSMQAIGSAIEYMKRYTFFAMFGLSAGEVDNDIGNTPEIQRISEKQAMLLDSMIVENELNRNQFDEWIRKAFKANSIDELSVNVFQDVKTALDKKIKAKK